ADVAHANLGWSGDNARRWRFRFLTAAGQTQSSRSHERTESCNGHIFISFQNRFDRVVLRTSGKISQAMADAQFPSPSRAAKMRLNFMPRSNITHGCYPRFV